MKLFSLCLMLCITVSAQSQDTAQVKSVDTVVVKQKVVDTTGKPPISARKAALYSFMAPGYGQIKLNRSNGAMLFALAEVAFIGMARKSSMDLKDAKAARYDSVLVSFDNTGKPQYEQGNLAPRLKARRAHYEDWLSAILFNHIFAAADAFVAANLWDLPTSVSRSKDGTTTVAATIKFR